MTLCRPEEHERSMSLFGLCPAHPAETVLPATHPEEDE